MYDIITLGSASIDVFVKSREEARKHENHIDLCYHLGDKVLIDNLVFTTGGGGTNTGVAFSRLGLRTGFIGCVGEDINGEAILRELKKEKVDFLGKVKEGNTGYSVILAGKNDRTILTFKGVNNNLEWKDINVSKIKARWLYLSSMLEKSFETEKKVAKYAKNRGIKVACNLSIYLVRKGLQNISDLLENCDILILNKEEAQVLSREKNIKNIIEKLKKYCRGIIVITDGFRVMYAYDGKIYIKEIRKEKAVDNTGAGDAFASGFVYGIIKGKSIQECMDCGHKEALSVLKEIGAKNNLLKRL